MAGLRPDVRVAVVGGADARRRHLDTTHGARITMGPEGLAYGVWVGRRMLTVGAFPHAAVPGLKQLVGELPYDSVLGHDGVTRIAVHADGALTAIWQDAQLWSVHGVIGRWEPPRSISSAGPHYQPRIVADDAGNELALWATTRYAAGVESSAIMTSWRPAGGVWQPEQRVAPTAGRETACEMAADGFGGAFAAWTDETPTRSTQWAARLARGGRAEVHPIAAHRASPGSQARLAVDARGNAVVVWSAHDGGRSDVYACRFVPGRGWLPPEVIGTGSANEELPAVAMSAGADIVAAWRRRDLTRARIWTRRFRSGAWEAPVPVPNDDVRDVTTLRVAADATGASALVLWVQAEPGVGSSVWASRYNGRRQ